MEFQVVARVLLGGSYGVPGGCQVVSHQLLRKLRWLPGFEWPKIMIHENGTNF